MQARFWLLYAVVLASVAGVAMASERLIGCYGKAPNLLASL
jgi:hypothetical protein